MQPTDSFDGASDDNQLFVTAWSVSVPLFGDSTPSAWQDAGQDEQSFLSDPGIDVTGVTSPGYATPGAASEGIDRGPADERDRQLGGSSRPHPRCPPGYSALERLP